MRQEKRSNQQLVIIALVGVIFGMTIGYSILNSVLSINGTSEISSTWDIHFEKIEENPGSLIDAKTLESSIAGNSSAIFNVELSKPGSTAEYIVTVKNGGTLDAKVLSISGIDEINETSPTDIVYSVSEIEVGDILRANESKQFKVKVEWKPLSTEIIDTNKRAMITINFVQAN